MHLFFIFIFQELKLFALLILIGIIKGLNTQGGCYYQIYEIKNIKM